MGAFPWNLTMHEIGRGVGSLAPTSSPIAVHHHGNDKGASAATPPPPSGDSVTTSNVAAESPMSPMTLDVALDYRMQAIITMRYARDWPTRRRAGVVLDYWNRIIDRKLADTPPADA